MKDLWPNAPNYFFGFFAIFEIRRLPKYQAPNTKPQRSSKSQAPNQGPSDVVAIQGGALKFGAWNFSGPSSAVAALSHPSSASCLLWRVEAWSLGFGAFRRSDSIENSEEPLFLQSHQSA